MTNFEKIKAMSVEQMAEQISDSANLSDCNMCPATTACGIELSCVGAIIKWLESEVEEDG